LDLFRSRCIALNTQHLSQANLDPKHHDRLAYIRVVSGKYEKGMKVVHSRSKKSLALAQAQNLFASDRETVLSAYPGDVIGINNPSGKTRRKRKSEEW
jgi:peptide chain release factor 3